MAPDSTIGRDRPHLSFDPKMQAQRPGLALANGVVLIAWGSHEDAAPYHGWVMGFDATTLARVGIFCVSPDTSAGGIWQGGRAPAIDAARQRLLRDREWPVGRHPQLSATHS